MLVRDNLHVKEMSTGIIQLEGGIWFGKETMKCFWFLEKAGISVA